jgi:hypothetical protein
MDAKVGYLGRMQQDTKREQVSERAADKPDEPEL